MLWWRYLLWGSCLNRWNATCLAVWPEFDIRFRLFPPLSGSLQPTLVHRTLVSDLPWLLATRHLDEKSRRTLTKLSLRVSYLNQLLLVVLLALSWVPGSPLLLAFCLQSFALWADGRNWSLNYRGLVQNLVLVSVTDISYVGLTSILLLLPVPLLLQHLRFPFFQAIVKLHHEPSRSFFFHFFE